MVEFSPALVRFRNSPVRSAVSPCAISIAARPADW